MPELPEVQTIVNDLQQIVGDQITGFVSYWPKAVKNSSVKKFVASISGSKILSIERIGKNIAIKLNSESYIILHLKMTGQLVLDNKNADAKYARHIFYLKKHGALEFRDIRKFGTLEIIDATRLAALRASKGIDPFAKDFTLKKFFALLDKQKNKVVKVFLMDPKIISGIGNIYASEILFEAKILPNRKTASLETEEIKKLYQSIKKILRKAVLLRGTSSSDYRDAKGEKGSFQNHLKVYQRAGKKCLKCDTIVGKVIIGQRSTFYCPSCQK
jgi:formamidopyrimidine-DNA glycosylase